MGFRDNERGSTVNDNQPHSAEQKADPANWRVGDVIMLRPDALSADNSPHPHAGRLGRIFSITPARPTDILLVSIEAAGAASLLGRPSDIGKAPCGAGTDTYLTLPAGMFLGLPEFCVETYPTRPGYSGWRISAEGRRVLVDGMGWPITPVSLGEE